MNKKQETNAFIKECITIALLKLMQTHKFSEITITELTKKAGVSRVSFYRNFECKEDVIRNYLKEILEKWNKKYENRNDFNLTEAIFEHYYEYRELYIMLYRQGLSQISFQILKNACGPKPEQDNLTAYVSAFLSYGLYGWIEEWFLRGTKETPNEMAYLLEEANKQKNNR